MGARKKIALTFKYQEVWIAGSYYVANIIRALNTLPDDLMPHLFILFEDKDGLDMIKEIRYPHISYLCTNMEKEGQPLKFLRKVIRKITGEDRWLKNRLRGVNYLFEGNEEFGFIPRHFYWVHDFQEFRLPDFFSAEDAANRSALPKRVSTLDDATLILSSHDALNDFSTFFPGYRCQVKILRFTSSLPDFSHVRLGEELERFHIQKPYFICSNQFWQHKNHKLILDSVNILKAKNLSYQIVFTGKNYDHRNPAYFPSLQAFIDENGLGRWINILGFIDRKVQLKLAENAISYIQPSLFEGWSTTVEDAKCMNQHILLSDIPVHQEQMDYNVTFFNPHDPRDLADKMERILEKGAKKEIRNYEDNIRTFGKEVLTVFS